MSQNFSSSFDVGNIKKTIFCPILFPPQHFSSLSFTGPKYRSSILSDLVCVACGCDYIVCFLIIPLYLGSTRRRQYMNSESEHFCQQSFLPIFRKSRFPLMKYKLYALGPKLLAFRFYTNQLQCKPTWSVSY